ncbi:MAG: CBS domain-containing protein [Bacteroidetes bacterium]|nr:CBS domain-containing protein [Bacteroidota bacterium]
MEKIRDVLKSKGGSLISIEPSDTVYNALVLMVEKNIGALLVLDRDGNLAGLITERNYARKVVLKGKSSKDTLVKEIMIEHPVTASIEDDVQRCMKIMTDKFIRYLPVMDGEKLVGLISMGDVIKYISKEQELTIETLEHYITG